jgi:phosphoadenosine phosphosulfate reductase
MFSHSYTPSLLPKSGDELHRLNRHLESLSLEEFLRWSLHTFGERIAHVTSFGPSGVVILDHLLRLKPDMRVMTIDTDFLFNETYELWDAIEQHYNIRIDVVRSPVSPEEQARQYGHHLWELEPDVCCDLRKVRPLARALAGLSAWYTGVRRDQSAGRAATPLLSWDTRYQLFKLSPLAGWTRGQVWEYIRCHDAPYNRLHDEGYTSIGCTHCTRPVGDAADERAGRWTGRQKTECGLHWAPKVHGGCPA